MSEGPPRWVKLLVPIGGLSIIPLVGLVYVATSKLGSDGPQTDGSGAAISGDDLPASATVARASAHGPRTVVPRAPVAKICCEKLHDLAQVAEVDKRATYMAAGSACEAADNDTEAFRQVASIIGGEKAQIPPECKSNQ